MAGILPGTPIIIKKDNLVRIITIQDLFYYPEHNQIKIWSKNKWSNILDIRQKDTNKTIFRISDNSNWVYLTEDTILLLKDGEELPAREIKEKIKLFQVEFPESNVLDLPDPNEFAEVPTKRILIPVSEKYKESTQTGFEKSASIRAYPTHHIISPRSKVSLGERILNLFDSNLINGLKDELPCFKCLLYKNHRVSLENCLDFCQNGKFLFNLYFDIYINARINKNAKQAFLLFRNNLEPYRIIVWNFLEMQKILILGSKVGYVPKFPDTMTPMYVRFKLSFESLREDFSYIPNPFTKEEYVKFMEDHYSNRLFVYPLTKLHGKAYDTREAVNNQEFLIDVCNVTTNSGKTQKLHVFNYKNDKIYNIITEDGFYQAGVGRLLIKGNL